jgi:DeoR/GlpR family transcriptional regulator of sugar metabolism
MQETPVKQRMLACAGRTIVLADSGKLGRSALSLITPLMPQHTVITDAEADGAKSQVLGLERLGCTVVEA